MESAGQTGAYGKRIMMAVHQQVHRHSYFNYMIITCLITRPLYVKNVIWGGEK